MQTVYLSEALASEYDEYFKIRCSPSDVYWNGHLREPDYSHLLTVFSERIGEVSLVNPGEHKIFFIRLKQCGNGCNPYVGFLQLTRYGTDIEIGYSVHDDYRGHGYATQALEAGVEIAKEYEGDTILRIRDDNIASQKVAYKNGFSATEEVDLVDYPNCGETNLRIYRIVKSELPKP